MNGAPPLKTRPRVLLFLAANPEETARLQIDEELREVREAVEKGRQRETLELQIATAVRASDVQHLIDNKRPDIVHFSGHGSESRGEIILLDDSGHAYPVPIEPLADLLKSCKGVVLNACSSAVQAAAIAKRGPWAIGMSAPIENGDAVVFARTLYGKLSDGVELAEAFEGGRAQLRLERRSGAELPQFFTGSAATALSETIAPARAPTTVELAFSTPSLEDPSTKVLLSLCLITDQPEALAAEVRGWKDELVRAPLLPAAVKERARKGNLAALFAEPLLKPQLFARLAVLGFSAYAYYGLGEPARALGASELNQRLLLEPLLHRLRKKSEPVAAIHSTRADLSALVSKAVAQVAIEEGRTRPAPELSSRSGRSLLELAQVVAGIATRHLAEPADEAAAAEFEAIRTRLRFAKDIVSGAIHTRDKDPLP